MVDWWALGILLYEMLVGIPPFFHRNKHRMYFLIKESPVNFPDPQKHGIDVSPLAKDIIRKLLDKNYKTRLGAKGGIDEIMAHPFFETLDPKKLLNKELVPPYRPEIGDELKFFDPKLTSKSEFEESVIDQNNKNLINKNKDIFNKF